MKNRDVLLIEDNPGNAQLRHYLFDDESSHHTELTLAESMAQVEALLTVRSFDMILLDLGFSDTSGLEAVRRVHATAPHIPLVVLSSIDDELLAVQALQEGAQEYLIKGQIDARGLLRALRCAIERKNMEESLFGEKAHAQITLNSIGDGVACTDTSGNITFLNLVAETITGWSCLEAKGRPMAEVLQFLNGKSGETASNPMEKAVWQNRPMHLPPDSVLMRRDGFETPIEDSIAPIHDHSGQAVGAVMVFRDVTNARELGKHMSYSAQHDFLTGLPNRMLLNDRIHLAIAMAPRHKKQVAILFLDLDGFKHINDSLGHPIGDKLLQSIAKRLVECVRVSDTVSRQGGDEFVVLLSEVDHPEDASNTARRMLQAVAGAHPIAGHDLQITTSIGVSIYPDDGLDAETLIKNADTAMYQAKENGRQNCQFFERSMNVRAVERQSMEENLRGGLERQEFLLYYQPRVHLITGQISGTEALLRWSHPTRGMISPEQFIPIAEDSGLILAIGNWVLREACRQAQAWLDAGLPLSSISVNVSALEFQADNFLGRVFTILEETGLHPKFLELELTESVFTRRPEITAIILKTLRESGIRVAVDDFGTGYSSLSALRKFPIDVLKIDQSFIRQITTTGDETTIVAAMIAMARSLKLYVVAEGVETQEQMEFLQGLECDEGQGFYFSRAVPAPQLALLLETGVAVCKTFASMKIENCSHLLL